MLKDDNITMHFSYSSLRRPKRIKHFGDVSVLESVVYRMSDLIELSRPRLGSGLGFSLQHWSLHSSGGLGNVVRSAIPGGQARRSGEAWRRVGQARREGKEQSVFVYVAFKAPWLDGSYPDPFLSVSHSTNVNRAPVL